MKKGTRVVHKKSGCILDVVKVRGNCLSCMVVFVPDGMDALGWQRGGMVLCTKTELEVSGGD